jgi:hypothetical protein
MWPGLHQLLDAAAIAAMQQSSSDSLEGLD